MPYYFRLLILYLIIAIFPVSIALEKEPSQLIFLSSAQQDTLMAKWNSLIYSELFTRVGIPIVIKYIPSKRASIMADLGQADGQLARIFEYQENHPNQLRINIPLYNVNFVAYTRLNYKIILDKKWESFSSGSDAIEYCRGIVAAEINLKGMVEPDRLSSVSTIKQGFLKLKYGRTDVFIYASLPAWEYINREDIKPYIVASGIIDTIHAYLYIHQKHKHLIPKIEKALLNMKNENFIQISCLEIFGQEASELCLNLGAH